MKNVFAALLAALVLLAAGPGCEFWEWLVDGESEATPTPPPLVRQTDPLKANRHGAKVHLDELLRAIKHALNEGRLAAAVAPARELAGPVAQPSWWPYWYRDFAGQDEFFALGRACGVAAELLVQAAETGPLTRARAAAESLVQACNECHARYGPDSNGGPRP